jgi:hypothetical protein
MKSRRAKDARGKLLPGGISRRELQHEGLHPVRWDLICPAAQRSMRLSWRHARREAGCRPRRWGVGLDVLSLLLARNAVDAAGIRARQPGNGDKATVDPAAGQALAAAITDLAATKEASRETPSHLVVDEPATAAGHEETW